MKSRIASGKLRSDKITVQFFKLASKIQWQPAIRLATANIPHFITFAVVNRIDALSRPVYKDILVDSLKHCQQEKGLIINGWVIMSNHVHLIARSQEGFQLADTMRDLKKFTSKKIEEAIRQNTFESRKDCLPVRSGGDALVI